MSWAASAAARRRFKHAVSRRSARRRGSIGGLSPDVVDFQECGRFVHDICLIQRRPDGLIRSVVGVEGVRYEGLVLLLQNQLFSMSTDLENGSLMFSIFNGVARQKPEVLDGLNLATLRDAGGSPFATTSVLQRMADLTGDREADEAAFEAAVAALEPLAPEGSIPPDLAAHLTRTVSDGPAGFLTLLFGKSMARGARLDEDAAPRKASV